MTGYDVQTVILAGGLGTRIQSIAPDTPKALMPVNNRPFVEHQFDLLRVSGLHRVLLLIGHFGEKIRDHVGDGSAFGMDVTYIQEDPDALLGTGGALVHALPRLDASFMMMYGDSYLPIDYRPVIDAFRQSDLPALMTVFRNHGLWDHSNVRFEGNRVVYYDKSAGPGDADCIDYGLSLFRRSAIETWKDADMPLDLARIQSGLVESGRMAAYEAPTRFYEIGKPEGLRELEDFLRANGNIP